MRERGETVPPTRAAPAVEWGLLLLVAAVKLVIHLVEGNGYGFHRDEYYYLACGRHPDWGYVDQPALVPLLAHVAEMLFGMGTLTPGELRWFSALASAGVVVFSGLMARELGGKRFAQGFAALTVLLMPIVLATGELFETVVFDQLMWALVLWLVLRTLRTGEGRGWLLVGLAAGIGVETKQTMGLLGLGLAAALLLTGVGRHHLRTPWPWLGGALALVLLLPNLLRQHAHGWPTPQFIHNNNEWNRQEWTLKSFLGFQILFVSPFALLMLGLGFRRAVMPAGKNGERVIVWIFAVVLATLLALRGKHYYLGAIYPALAAVGSVAVEDLTGCWIATRPSLERWLRPAWVAAAVLCALPLVPLVLPMVPRTQLAGSWAAKVNHDFGEETGWPELAAQVMRIFSDLPAQERAQTTILTVNYSEAGAIQFFGDKPPKEMPVVSCQNNYWIWGSGARNSQTVIIVGARHRPWMEKLFGRVEQVATIDNPLGIANDERGAGIFICREPKRTLRAAWPDLKSFD